jgi:hypothetical protein
MEKGKQVCINHPEVIAEFHCYRCSKPLCLDCVIIEEGINFCSRKCYQDYLEFRERRKKLASAKKPRPDYGKWIFRAFIVAILAIVLYYIFVANEVRSLNDLEILWRSLVDKFGA